MARKSIVVILIVLILSGCTSQAAPLSGGNPEETQMVEKSLNDPAVTQPVPTSTSVPQPEGQEIIYPEQGVGPVDFPVGFNPLTGYPVDEVENLEERPVIVKVENMPRDRSRPQWGLTLADHVYEYYIEGGDTRFTAVFLGERPNQVGPIRSARHIDIQLIQMYKGLFIFGGAYPDLYDLLLSSDFSDRLIREGPNTAPALYRYDPNRDNQLMVDTQALDAVVETYQMDNSPQDLSGLFFQMQAPEGGEVAEQGYVRFSGAVYNRWDYDSTCECYLRYSDADNDVDRTNEIYEQLTDQLSDQPVSADNVVILMAHYESLSDDADVFDVQLKETGRAYILRNGKIYSAQWLRKETSDLISLVEEDGTPFPLKPGKTWFEVMNDISQIDHEDELNAWRFTFVRP